MPVPSDKARVIVEGRAGWLVRSGHYRVMRTGNKHSRWIVEEIGLDGEWFEHGREFDSMAAAVEHVREAEQLDYA